MNKKKYMLIILSLLLIISTGCGAKETKKSGISEMPTATKEGGDEQGKEEVKEQRGAVIVNPSELPEPPRNQKEYDEMFGVVDEDGKWIPPEGAYRDPKTGNIKNKDGIVIAGGETPHPARPGSKG